MCQQDDPDPPRFSYYYIPKTTSDVNITPSDYNDTIDYNNDDVLDDLLEDADAA